MGNTKNLIYSVLVVVSFIFLWDAFVVSRYAPPQKTTPADTIKLHSDPISPDVVQIEEPTVPEPLSANQIEPTAVHLENAASRVTLDSRGARVTSWQVKEKDKWVELVYHVDESKQSPLETFPTLQFTVQHQDRTSATLAAKHPNGFRITKTLTISERTKLNRVRVDYQNTSSQPIQINAALGWGPGIDKSVVGEEIDPKEKKALQSEMRAVGYADKVKTWRPGFIFGRTIHKTDPDNFYWAGVDNDHFIVAFIGGEDSLPGVKIDATKQTPPVLSLVQETTLHPGEKASFTYPFFIGPKDMHLLNKVGHHLNKSVDFGFFGVISKFLLKGLEFFEGMTGNYGWAIIILTICVQIIFYPLTKKSLQHTLKMKEVQPQLKKIQSQFKSDPKRMQIETFNLYKRHGMKFMGMEGCFPMLIQIPIFFAFYRALRVAYELRGAPWIFWIKDLALPDPFFVLPILMGGGMILQQKLTAVAMDPAQAKMMMIMPVVFTFLFLKLPAGLVLYWVVNSITTIVVQKYLQWRNKPRPKAAT